MTIKRHFDQDLDALRGKLLEMGGLCEDMIHLAVKVLTEREESFLKDVEAKEDRVNDLHIEIDELALRLIALHQPADGERLADAAAAPADDRAAENLDAFLLAVQKSLVNVHGIADAEVGDFPLPLGGVHQFDQFRLHGSRPFSADRV